MSLVANLLFYAGLVVALGIGGLYFRDLGDVTQMFLKVKRENMARFHPERIPAGRAWRDRPGDYDGGAFSCSVAGPFWVWLVAFLLGAVLLIFPYVWVHVGLRNQKASARYYSISDAAEWVSPSSPVIVIENKGVARAHPDAQIMRPHLAGNQDGLAGENVIMTYCAMANLGIGYTPTVAGEPLDLEVLAQHSNNLILRDNRTGEPIQQIFGFRDRDRSTTPEGTSCPVKPELAMKTLADLPHDHARFRQGLSRRHGVHQPALRQPVAAPVRSGHRDGSFPPKSPASTGSTTRSSRTCPRTDTRLHNKTYVWGVEINGDVACWTDDFVIEQGNVVNAVVGGRDLVIAWDPRYESLGLWYNDTGAPVTTVDFFGKTPDGQLQRVENVRPGMFWHVWADFFPHTDINRVGTAAEAKTPGTTGATATEAAQ